MKRIIYSSLLLCIFNFNLCQAQKNPTKNKIIEIQPFGTDSYFKRVKKGERVKFKIFNVNTFKINGYVVSKPLIIDYAVPSMISALISNIKVPEIANQNTPAHQAYTSKDLKCTDSIKLLSNEVKDFKKRLSEKTRIDSLQLKFKENYTIFIHLFQSISSYSKLEELLYSNLADSIFIRDTCVLKNNCKSLYNSIYDATRQLPAKKCIINDLQELDLSFTALSLDYQELHNMQLQDTLLLNGKLTSTENNTSLIINNALFKLEKKPYFEDEYKYAKKVFDQLHDIKNREALIEKAYKGIDLYEEIKNADFISETESQQVNGDGSELTPTLKYSNGKVAKEFPAYQIRTYGGIKVNFSAGYLLSFKGDDNYSLFTDSNGKIGVEGGKKNSLTHSIGALAHVYYRNGCDVNGGLSAGFSITTSGYVGFYLGASVMFFEKHRLIITSGISYVKFQQLNTSNLMLNSDGTYSFKSNADNTLHYDQLYKPAFFVGITINIAGN